VLGEQTRAHEHEGGRADTRFRGVRDDDAVVTRHAALEKHVDAHEDQKQRQRHVEPSADQASGLERVGPSKLELVGRDRRLCGGRSGALDTCGHRLVIGAARTSL
jgi:hypothetical protein